MVFFGKSSYKAFIDYFQEKELEPYFETLDSLTRLMANVSYEHQGRRIEGMRMQNLGDAYMVNGWEAMPMTIIRVLWIFIVIPKEIFQDWHIIINSCMWPLHRVIRL